MLKYCLGFAVCNRFEVALILKDHPEYQAGKLNGIGGSLKESESPSEAMIREFREESKVEITEWGLFAVIGGEDWTCYCYTSSITDEQLEMMCALTESSKEPVKIVQIDDLPTNLVDYVSWLIPMALEWKPNHVHHVRTNYISPRH